jgi:uncharacterized membrane protein YozB (DUF420 family)
MLSAILTNFLFLILYVTRLFSEGNTHFKGPKNHQNFIYLPILIFHIVTALISIFYVVKQVLMVIRHVNNSPNGTPQFMGEIRLQHRKNGLLTFYIWSFSFLGGIIIFLLLYVIY